MSRDIKLSIPDLGEEELQNVTEVLESGWLAPGKFNQLLENQFIDLVGSKYALSMNSCASALEIAIKAHDIKGEVIVPSFTWVASVNAIVNNGATPVFCDIDFDYRNTTVELIEPLINSKTEAVMVVHFGGQPCDMTPIYELCEKYKLLLIEDSAETLGACVDGKQAGSFGIGCFSFFPTKNMTTGEGGMFTCNDEKIYKIAKSLIGHGIGTTTLERNNKVAWYREAISSGHNFRMSNIHAAIGHAQFNRLEEMNNNRKNSADFYDHLLVEKIHDVGIPKVGDNRDHVYQMYTITVEEKFRNEVVEKLNNKGIGASVHFDPPVHKQEYYQNIKSRTSLENTEKLSNSIITLPMYSTLKEEDITYIVEELCGIIKNKH
tara:strand:- start:808 stop:1938 length:1131 start_codon:yes stop_codon:yes gene_type:complete